MASLNKVFIIGRLTKDPDLRYLPNGTPKAELRLATSREWKDRNGQQQKDTCYVDVVVWSRQAEIAKQYLNKGRQVFVEGRLDYQEWERDGQRRSKHQVVAERVQFLDRDGGGAPSEGGRSGAYESRSYGSGNGGNGGSYGGGSSYGGNGGSGSSYGNGGGNGGGNGSSYQPYGGKSYGGQTYGGNYDGPPDGPPPDDMMDDMGAPMSEAMGVADSDLPF